MRRTSAPVRRLGAPAALLLAATGFATGAESSTTPTPGPSPTPSLAQVARDRELDSSEADRDDAGHVVITDDNLDRLAARGGLTETTRTPAAPTGMHVEDQPDRSRAAWREVYRRQRELVRDLETAIDELDQRIPTLWTRFYAADNPDDRDRVIKVELDRALVTRAELERSLQEERPKLMEILEAARRAGAPPGWLRDLVE